MRFFRGLSALPCLFILSLSAILTLHLHGARGQGTPPLCNDKLICLDQDWTEDERRWWYTTSQGSRLLPLSWMLALEGADLTSPEEKFLSEHNVAHWGYLANPASEHNLPVGFAVDQDKSFNDDGPVANIMCDTFPAHCRSSVMQKPWVGLTCAACHTNDIKFGGKTFRVEGASGLADFQAFNEDLLRALKNTLEKERFQRFATGVLGGNTSRAQQAALREQLAEQIAWKEKLAEMNKGDVRYGHGRIDAQGHILNRVALTTRPESPINKIRPNAPASIPFIWNTHQQSQVQWNGIAKLHVGVRGPLGRLVKKAGALIRNTSEVIGVFAHVESHGRRATQGYKSSVRVGNIDELETLLIGLRSPRWPEDILGPIDQAKASRGKTQFDAKCISCHSNLAWNDVDTRIQVEMTPIQDIDTDVSLACNTFFHRSRTRKFEGQKVYVFRGDRIASEDATSNMLTNLAIGAVWRKAFKKGPAPVVFDDVTVSTRGDERTPPPEEALPGVSDKAKKDFAQECLSKKDPLLAYKARPLNGAWATAPYLHNGSVPTLYDLLLPAKVRQTRRIGIPDKPAGSEFRPESFGVGSTQFDPKNVGFVTDPAANPTIFHTKDPNSGEPIPGNLNSGHDYGTDLTEDQRRDLVEYLKTL